MSGQKIGEKIATTAVSVGLARFVRRRPLPGPLMVVGLLAGLVGTVYLARRGQLMAALKTVVKA